MSDNRVRLSCQPLEDRLTPATYTVDTPHDFPGIHPVTRQPLLTLRQAIGLANGNPGFDSINFHPDIFDAGGSVTLTLLSALPAITETAEINGKVSRNNVQLNKPVVTPAGGIQCRVFEVAIPFADRKADVNFTYLEIVGGTATGEGGPLGVGIKSTNANLWVEDCILRNNHADTDGGGIWANGFECTILISGSATSIQANDADGFGGGISVLNAYLTVKKGAKIENNDADVSGGGIHFLTDAQFVSKGGPTRTASCSSTDRRSQSGSAATMH